MSSSETTEQMLNHARGELGAAQDAVARWEAVVSALEAVSAEYAALPSSLQAKPKSTFPIPRDAILSVMKDRPNVAMRLKDVLSLVRDSGTYDDTLDSGDNAYGVALRRLVRSDKYPIKQNDDGTYYYSDGAYMFAGLPLYAGPHPRPDNGGLLEL
jgi:hypothetical protein